MTGVYQKVTLDWHPCVMPVVATANDGASEDSWQQDASVGMSAVPSAAVTTCHGEGAAGPAAGGTGACEGTAPCYGQPCAGALQWVG